MLKGSSGCLCHFGEHVEMTWWSLSLKSIQFNIAWISITWSAPLIIGSWPTGGIVGTRQRWNWPPINAWNELISPFGSVNHLPWIYDILSYHFMFRWIFELGCRLQRHLLEGSAGWPIGSIPPFVTPSTPFYLMNSFQCSKPEGVTFL